MGYRFRSSRADRFDNYREMIAKFAGTCGNCSCAIKAGEHIGYNGGCKKAVCGDCYRKWAYENAEAANYEAAGCSGY